MPLEPTRKGVSMSFFGKIKQGLGIGTASLEIVMPVQIDKAAGQVTGRLALTGKSDQTVKSVNIKLVELYTHGQGEEKRTKEFVLGELPVYKGEPFSLKADERKEMDFVLPFSLKLSGSQSLAQKDGVLGVLGKAAVFASSEKSDFQIRATADLDGVALDPADTKVIKLI